MKRLTTAAIGFLFLSTAILAVAQGRQYVISNYAGGAPPPAPVLRLNMAIGSVNALASDDLGNLYFASYTCVFRLDRNGGVTRVAGNSQRGYSGDGGPAIHAQLFSPAALAVDGAGNLFIADSSNSRIRKVSPNGIITTITGNGHMFAGYSGDGGPATSANGVSGPLAVDGAGNLSIAFRGIAGRLSGHIRMISPDGIITTVAGEGLVGYSGDGGLATAAQLFTPSSIAEDSAGNVYIAGSFNSAVRILRPVSGPF